MFTSRGWTFSCTLNLCSFLSNFEILHHGHGLQRRGIYSVVVFPTPLDIFDGTWNLRPKPICFSPRHWDIFQLYLQQQSRIFLTIPRDNPCIKVVGHFFQSCYLQHDQIFWMKLQYKKRHVTLVGRCGLIHTNLQCFSVKLRVKMLE